MKESKLNKKNDIIVFIDAKKKLRLRDKKEIV